MTLVYHHDVINNAGTIKSPIIDTPVGYSCPSNCSSLITVDLDDLIILNFTILNIGVDVLTIYDGINSSAHVIKRFIRHNNYSVCNISLVSSTNSIYILLSFKGLKKQISFWSTTISQDQQVCNNFVVRYMLHHFMYD